MPKTSKNMYIQTEETPNPNTIKFIPGVEVSKKESYHFNKSDDDYFHSPLAQRLFEIDSVRAVFLGQDFISVTKEDDVKWDRLKTYVLAGLVDHFVAGMPVIEEKKGSANQVVDEKIHSEIEKQIIELIDTKVRPAVAQDGGDIIYKKFEDGVVYLELHGACQGCPSSTITLKQGIENMLKHYVPEVQSVESI
jgi:Fe-S cluster biogenesis protein NfuA